MKNLGFLLAANLSIWLLIFGYITILFKKNKELNRKINKLRLELEEKKKR